MTYAADLLFSSRKAAPILEFHHARPSAEDGPDTIGNAVALCPNCHRQMHVLKRAASKQALIARINE